MIQHILSNTGILITYMLTRLCSVMSDSLWPHGLQPTRFLCPCDSPGKNTGVGCHSLLQRILLIQGLNLLIQGLIQGLNPALQADSLPSELQYVRPFDVVSHLLVISSVGFSLFSFISVSICVPSVDLSLVHWNFLCAICWVVLFSFSKNNKKDICWSPNPSISEYDCFGYRVCFGDLFKK